MCKLDGKWKMKRNKKAMHVINVYALNLHVNKNNTKICLDTVYSYRQSSLKGTSFVIFLMLAPNTYSIQSAYFIWCIQHWINKAIVAFVCVFELPLLRSVLVYVAKNFISFWFVQTFCVFTTAFFSLSLFHFSVKSYLL